MKKMHVIPADAATPRNVQRKAFHVMYRLADKRTPHGTYQERYDALIAKLEKMPAVLRRGHFNDAAHIATSSWLVRADDDTPQSLGRKLSESLTPGDDLLEVLRVTYMDRYELTIEAPKP